MTWIAEPSAQKGAWIKDSRTGEWVALSCGNTHESAKRHADMIAAIPAMHKALEAARVVLIAENAKATLAIVDQALAAYDGKVT